MFSIPRSALLCRCNLLLPHLPSQPPVHLHEEESPPDGAPVLRPRPRHEGGGQAPAEEPPRPPRDVHPPRHPRHWRPRHSPRQPGDRVYQSLHVNTTVILSISISQSDKMAHKISMKLHTCSVLIYRQQTTC